MIPNLPVDVSAFAVEHPHYALPAVPVATGYQRRTASVTLLPAATNRVSVQLEPLGKSTIRHY